MDNYPDNDADLRSVHVSKGRTGQRNVHSTSAHDGMVVLCERKCNRAHTRSYVQSNPDIDVWRPIDGKVSMRTLRARPHVGEVLWEYCVFDPDTPEEIRSVSNKTCLVNRRPKQYAYLPFRMSWTAWEALGGCKNHHHHYCWTLVLQETRPFFLKGMQCVMVLETVVNPWPEHVWSSSLVGFVW